MKTLIERARFFVIAPHLEMDGTHAVARQGLGQCGQNFGSDATPAHARTDVDFIEKPVEPGEFERPAEGDDRIPYGRAARTGNVDRTMRRPFEQREKCGAAGVVILRDASST